MVIYHGSTEVVEKPEIRTSENYLDFGTGFYTTTSYEQAKRWAQIKKRRNNSSVGYVSIYEFDFDAAKNNTRIKQFDSADMEWLIFVTENRNGITQNEKFDMHIGPVADDNVYKSIRLFETGVLNAEETIVRLKTEILNDQWALHTEDILSYCKFIDVKEIK